MRLRDLRKSKGITQNKLAEALNISRSTIAMYETDASEPDLDTLQRIADFFDVSVDNLIGREIEKNIEAAELDHTVVKIPVFGTIPAGVPIEMIEASYIEDYEEIPKAWVENGSKYFCLKVKGESMMPKFENDDVLILRQQGDCNSGDYCAISINHTECTFKKVIKKESGLTLMPLNAEFEPMFFTNKEVLELPITILGVVKEVRRSL